MSYFLTHEVFINSRCIYVFVFYDLYFSCVIYLPVWGGFLTAALIAKIDALLLRAVLWGYGCELKCLSDPLYDSDHKLFRRMAASSHCIHQ